MAHPHFRDDDETQRIDRELGRQVVEKLRNRVVLQLLARRRLQVEHHDRHQNGDDPIAECLDAVSVWRCRGRLHGPSLAYIPSGPRWIATMPVRDTSTRPIGNISAMKLSILSEAPVISNTKLSVPASMTRARK